MTELTGNIETLVRTGLAEPYFAECDGSSKTRLRSILDQLSLLQLSVPDIITEISAFTYLHYASTKGGKAFTHDTYLTMAYESVEHPDRELAREHLCDMIVVQKARANLIAVGDYVLKNHGIESGINLHKQEQSAQMRLCKTLTHRGFAEAKLAADSCAEEHESIRYFLEQYSRFATTRFIFDELNIPANEGEVQYNDRAVRSLLKGCDKTKGFPVLADRVLFGWLLKFNDPCQFKRLMHSCANFLEMKLGTEDPDYFRLRKMTMFLRYIAAEELWQHQSIQERCTFISREGSAGTNMPEQLLQKVDLPEFFREYGRYLILPQSLRSLFSSIALNERPSTNFKLVFPNTSHTEGIRIIKGVLLSGNGSGTRNQLHFDSNNYYEGLRQRLASTIHCRD